MAFALVNFYEEDSWDVIPYSDIVFTDQNTENVVIEGSKMLVLWKDSKSKKANKRKFPAEIVKISGLKLHPFVLTKKPLSLISHLFRNIDILCMCVKNFAKSLLISYMIFIHCQSFHYLYIFTELKVTILVVIPT